MSEDTITFGWRAPSNIALIKYWGKRENQLPENGSLSITLEKSTTTTYLSFRKKEIEEYYLNLQYFFHGAQQPQFERKISQLINSLLIEMPFLAEYELVFRSENNFPHSTGIASSASSMSALALCLVSMEEKVTGNQFNHQAFYQRASTIARLGSGSASRSLYGGVVTWGAIPSIEQSSDEYATPFLLPPENRLNKVRDIILIVSSKEKMVLSGSGCALAPESKPNDVSKATSNTGATFIRFSSFI